MIRQFAILGRGCCPISLLLYGEEATYLNEQVDEEGTTMDIG